jgi:hypothetical protein
LAEGVVEHIITRRGFVDTVVLQADEFTVHADTIFTYAPMLRELHVMAVGGRFSHRPEWR